MALKRKYVESAADAALVNLKLVLTLKGENRPIVVDASVPASVYGKLEQADIESIALASNRSFIAFEEKASK